VIDLVFNDPRLPAAFWQRVVPDPTSECWHWTGQMHTRGYGKFRGKPVHRFVVLTLGAELPDGHHVGHTCHDEAVSTGSCAGGPTCPHRRCIRHLEPQTPKQNNAAARPDVAPCGHPYTATTKEGHRYCQPCKQKRSLEQGHAISRAAQALNLTISQYVTQHGRSTKKAKQILEGATCHLAKIPGGPA
jgi:hypothetical protein